MTLKELESSVRNYAIFQLSASLLLATLSQMTVGSARAEEQAEWAQRYDADARLTVSRSTTPILPKVCDKNINFLF